LTFIAVCGIIYNVKGRGKYQAELARGKNFPKIFQKTFEKPLDKYQKVWYNIYVIKREPRLSLINKFYKEKKKEGKQL
jgi:hypothetical protein